MLHFLQVVLDHVQPVDAAFEVFREHGEQRRDLGILEVLKLGDDVIAFLAGLHPVDKVFQALVPQTKLVDAFGKHSGEEESIVPDMLAYLALAIERGRRAVDWI